MTVKRKPTHHGKPCKRCGGTERYSGSSSCVVCQKTRQSTGPSQYASKGPPAEVHSERDMVVSSIERAKLVLAGIGQFRDGMYLLDGHHVTLGQFLMAANDLIARQNADLPREKRKPLIGNNHHRWGQ